MTLLEQAASRIHEHVVVPAEANQAAARKRLVERAMHRSLWPRRLVIPAAVALVMVVVGVVVWPRGESAPITFTVGPTAQGVVGNYVTPAVGETVSLTFSEGSSVELLSETRARVTQTTPLGAVVLLESGQARVDIVHRPHAAWTVVAGSYSIEVHGTSFDVAFDPESQTLEIVMRDGVVGVSGPGLETVEVRGAQRFVHRAQRGRRTTPSVARDVAPLASSSAMVLPSAPPRKVASAASRAPTRVPPRVSWGRLAAQGDHAGIVSDAEARGLESVIATASSAQLMTLANAARFERRAELAVRSYRAVRQRFPSTAAAAEAAFQLGRMTERSSPAGAVAWYERYVREAPGGPYVAEALGRRMVALDKSGAQEAALRAAADYLERFPRGPYAGVAREMTAH